MQIDAGDSARTSLYVITFLSFVLIQKKQKIKSSYFRL